MPTVLVSSADRLMCSAESSRFLRRIGLGFKIFRPLAKLPSYVISHRDAGKLPASVGQRSESRRIHRPLSHGCLMETNICWSDKVRLMPDNA